ncbi:unnamed protein product, partial [Amoebophrya sp. A25]
QLHQDADAGQKQTFFFSRDDTRNITVRHITTNFLRDVNNSEMTTSPISPQAQGHEQTLTTTVDLRSEKLS